MGLNFCNLMIEVEWVWNYFLWMNKESCWVDNKRLTILHKLSWQNSGNFWENWLQYWKKFLLQVKCYQTSLNSPEKSSMKGRGYQCGKLNFVLFYEIATATPTFSKHHPDQLVATNIGVKSFPSKKIYISLKAQIMVSLFLAKSFKLRYVLCIFRHNDVALLIDYSIVYRIV